MGTPVRFIAIGATVGIGLSAAFALTSKAATPVVAPVIEVVPAPVTPSFDTSTLVKFKGDTYRIDYDAGISSDVLSTTMIKKIEAGRVSYVTVGVTSTGTYSSEGLVSPHVRYPGVQVTRVANEVGAVASLERKTWKPLSLASANSFVSFGLR